MMNNERRYQMCPVNCNTFPGKLWNLVHNEEYESIRWSDCGTTVIVDAHHFKEEVLRTAEYNIFKTQNFSSFVRQLNLYGFRKLATTASAKFVDAKLSAKRGGSSLSCPIHCFAHSFFQQRRPDLLCKVRRTTSASKRRAATFGDDSAYYYYGQYGNTFRIVGRCEQSAMTSNSPLYIPQTHTKSRRPRTSSSKVFPSLSVEPMEKSFLDHESQPRHLNSSFSFSESDRSDIEDDDDENGDSSKPSGLFTRSSANVLWGQCQTSAVDSGFLNRELSHLSSPHLVDSVQAAKTLDPVEEQAASFPSNLRYDVQGRCQNVVVIQQSPSLGTLPRTPSLSPPLPRERPNAQVIFSPTMWTSAMGSGGCNYSLTAPQVHQTPSDLYSSFCGSRPVLCDFSAMPPLCPSPYPPGPTGGYSAAAPTAPDYIHRRAAASLPESMTSVSRYPCDGHDGVALGSYSSTSSTSKFPGSSARGDPVACISPRIAPFSSSSTSSSTSSPVSASLASRGMGIDDHPEIARLGPVERVVVRREFTGSSLTYDSYQAALESEN